MMQMVDTAMQALQAALFGAEVYSLDHPAVRVQREQAMGLLGQVFKERERVSLIAFDDRVVYEDAPLPSSERLAGGLFERLRVRGVECLTLERGVTDAEIGELLGQLPEKVGAGAGIEGSRHVRFGFIQGASGGGNGDADGGSGEVLMGTDLRRRAGAMQQVWKGVYQGQEVDGEVLGAVVADICTTVAISGGVMLPLASLKTHDEYTFVHTINVALMSAGLAEAVGLRADQVHDLTLAALMHDVGKRRVPKRMLQKNGPLDDQELRVMQSHPMEGARVLFGVKGIPDVARVVAFEHHMHLNGTGYPHVSPDWKTSLASQIVQVADVFDALRTHRPYREALPLEKAKQIMFEDIGVKYDRTLLEVFYERVAQKTDREMGDACGAGALTGVGGAE